MKKTITSLFLIFILSNFACAQSEPEAINTKDLMDKIDRSEISLEKSDSTLENIIPDFEIPTIEFNTADETPAKSKGNQTPTKNINDKTPESITSKNPVPTQENKVVLAKKLLTIGQLLPKDKVVISKGKTYVYRLSNKIITQYKIKDKIPLKSLGLKTSGKNSFYIVDATLLKKDAKALKSNHKRTKNKNRKRSNRKPVKTVKAKTVQKVVISPDVLTKRALMEEKFNHGRTIERTILLKRLLVNDTIVISNGIQMVIRKKQTTSGENKYWLTEKIDINHKALQKQSNNVYKLIRAYK